MTTMPRSASVTVFHFRILLGGICLATVASVHAQQPAGASTRVRFVVDARQLGPVGYRDPIGVMSPDGEWLAYASGGRLRLTPVAGGVMSSLGPRTNVRAIAWPDSRHVAALEFDGAGGGD